MTTFVNVTYVLNVQYIYIYILHAPENEHNRHTISCMFRHFFSAFIRDYFYRLKSCPSNCFVLLSHSQSQTVTYSKNQFGHNFNWYFTPWWRHSRSAETCMRLCVYFFPPYFTSCKFCMIDWILCHGQQTEYSTNFGKHTDRRIAVTWDLNCICCVL